MRAMQVEGAFGLENLKAADLIKPEPGPGQVLVKLNNACLNYRDLAIVSGFGGNYPLPLVPLSDGAGVVEAVGAGVSRVAAGERVSPLFFQGWIAGEPTPTALSGSVGGPINGCAEEYICLSEEGVSKLPDMLSDAEAACLPCAGLTAWRALVSEGQIKAGNTVLLQGTGGVSIFGLQFAKAAGAEVIITSSSDEKLERAKELGADHVINYKATPDWAAEARKITGGRGVDHVVEVGGAETLQQSIMAARVGGHIAVIGLLSGLMKDVNVAAIFSQNLTIKGITVGNREQFEDMVRGIERNNIKPVIDAHYGLEELGTALGHMAGASHFGKIVIDIA
ncbi:NAD(P)-dependent alcohol dehydrogenase [Parvibaculaceae bacterium PLY_AMNH_Bact1]|nr:NAD(P)-dependent alcohol dehydrogenase [Parvibaculaceae bacterium PLY_AMNH_Bact1]